jgi:hypothetical protein
MGDVHNSISGTVYGDGTQAGRDIHSIKVSSGQVDALDALPAVDRSEDGAECGQPGARAAGDGRARAAGRGAAAKFGGVRQGGGRTSTGAADCAPEGHR